MIIIVFLPNSEPHCFFFFVVVVFQEKSSTKKTAENKWNVELSLELKVNIIKYLTKRILVISKSDTWNLICPGY